ncbi:hypothetical protein HYX02_04925 [Candidatus Woesearchaeota archaeon]|nr:hypothetical protein [Candidatus Woesearchaeota archaeon]
MKKSKIGSKQEKLENLKDELHLDSSIKEIEEMLNYIDKRRKILMDIGRL